MMSAYSMGLIGLMIFLRWELWKRLMVWMMLIGWMMLIIVLSRRMIWWPVRVILRWMVLSRVSLLM
nr:MAG TPA: hypothetical protein [Caudoviricetes sp.]